MLSVWFVDIHFYLLTLQLCHKLRETILGLTDIIQWLLFSFAFSYGKTITLLV